MSGSVAPDSDNVSSVLGYFNDPNRIPFLWSFPDYNHFDATINTTATPYGDLASSATATEKTVGQTWSDPAVGQVKDTSGSTPWSRVQASCLIRSKPTRTGRT